MISQRQLISTGSPFEPKVGISRAVRSSQIIAVTGTAPLSKDGKTVAMGDAAGQARRCLEIIQSAIEALGGKLSDVVRTRILLIRIEDWERVATVHGEFFGSIRPANTIMQVVRFIDPDWLLEIEADAVVEDSQSVNMNIDEERPFTEDMKRIVAEQKLAFVATVCPDGTPNLSPKGTIAVWDDTHLAFADIRSPRTVANLQDNPTIEINVVDPFVRKGYRFKGTAEVVTGGDLFQKMIDFYSTRRVDTARTRPLPSIRAFVLMKVKTALPLISPAYDDGTDESVIRANWVAYFRKLNELE